MSQMDCDTIHYKLYLQLDDFSVLRVLDNSAVASKLFLRHLDDLLEVILCGEALDGGERLAAVPLLDPDVDEALVSGTRVLVSGGVRKRIVRLQVLNTRHS